MLRSGSDDSDGTASPKWARKRGGRWARVRLVAAVRRAASAWPKGDSDSETASGASGGTTTSTLQTSLATAAVHRRSFNLLGDSGAGHASRSAASARAMASDAAALATSSLSVAVAVAVALSSSFAGVRAARSTREAAVSLIVDAREGATTDEARHSEPASERRRTSWRGSATGRDATGTSATREAVATASCRVKWRREAAWSAEVRGQSGGRSGARCRCTRARVVGSTRPPRARWWCSAAAVVVVRCVSRRW
mmetsp:Transcript_3045/g.9989  ORF Transcript_3045/g.9989 Transcript_3045/m.9989 type:complete len:253 (-) Transcript_3045:272-1030(-)